MSSLHGGMVRGFIWLLLCGTLPAGQDAPQSAASIAGVVVDAKGVPVPGATVKLFAPAAQTPVVDLTDEDGAFRFENLAPGAYRLVVEMEGFLKVDLSGIEPAAEPGRRLRLTLERPKAAAPSTAAAGQKRPAQPASAGQRQAADQSVFREVEVSGIAAAEQSLPSAAQSGAETAPARARDEISELLVITGNPTASMDAGDWNDPNFRERIMEMAGRMGFGPGEQRGPGGRFGGPGGEGGPGMAGPGRGGGPGFGGFGLGGRGAMARQSPINGSVYSNYANSFFNARPYSITGEELPKPVHIENSFGISLGGRLPWGASAASAAGGRGQGRMGGPGGRMGGPGGMWFVSYGGSRNRNPFDVLTTVPTALERAGDFSQTMLRSGPLAGQAVRLYDPFSPTHEMFADGRIPLSRIDPIAAALLKYIPPPNLPGSVQNYTMQRGLVNVSDEITARINSPLTSKSNVGVNYGFRRGHSISSQAFPGLDSDRTNRAHNFGLNGMYRIRPRLVTNFRVSFNRVRVESSNPFAFRDDVAGRLGIQGVSRDPVNYGIPNINFTNYGDLQLAAASLNRSQTLGVGGGLNRIGTKHTVQLGADMAWNQRNTVQDANARGTFQFTGFATSAFDAAGRPVAGTGYDLADFLLGLPYSTSRRYGSSNNYLRNKNFNIFVQDNWRVRSNLTLSIGLRYEYIQPFYEKYDHMVNLDVAPGFTAVAQVFPGQEGPYSGRFPRSLLYSDRNNFGPRIGIAWKPKASSPWVFRTGYGLFYNPSVYPTIVSQLVGQPPFAVSQDILTTPSAPLTLQNGFPFLPDVTILNTFAIDPHYRIGYVQQWNLNIQTQVFRLYAVEIGYNGSKGTRLDILRAPNRAPSGSSPGDTEKERVIGDAGNFVYQESGANSILHAMQIRVNRRFSRGFRLQTSYTLSKSIDNASGIGGERLTVVQDEHNIRAERSLSSFDQRHRFETDFSFDLPLGERRRFWAGAGPVVQKFIAGWTITGRYQLASGNPLTARLMGNVANNSGTGSNFSERPDSTGLPVALPRSERSTARFFNTLAFAIPRPGVFGNAGRNTIPGPGSNLMDLTLRKSFRLDENNRRLDFTWQVANVFNHPNYAGVATTVNALNFGRVTGARAMRTMQFNLRLNF